MNRFHKLVLLYSIAVLPFSAYAESGIASQQGQMTIIVTGFKNNLGTVKLALVSKKSNYLSRSKQPFRGQSGAINNKQANIEFPNIPYGEYAISVFHDTNNNNQLDANFFGLPAEPYGFSNNAKVVIGPPSFEKARFSFGSENHVVQIRLQ